jgi:hypothetical protein
MDKRDADSIYRELGEKPGPYKILAQNLLRDSYGVSDARRDLGIDKLDKERKQ